MKEPTKESPHDRGEVLLPGTCQVCGAEGPTIAARQPPSDGGGLPGAPAP